VDIIEEFLKELVNYARNLVLGDPLDNHTTMGPVCSKPHYDKIKSYIDLAVKNGHKIMCGETVE
jgi:acyl-CoA reductase-like NAD-dependent aldehyde dehydrogenase